MDRGEIYPGAVVVGKLLDQAKGNVHSTFGLNAGTGIYGVRAVLLYQVRRLHLGRLLMVVL